MIVVLGTRAPSGTLGLVHAPTLVIIWETLNVGKRSAASARSQHTQQHKELGDSFVGRLGGGIHDTPLRMG